MEIIIIEEIPHNVKNNITASRFYFATCILHQFVRKIMDYIVAPLIVPTHNFLFIFYRFVSQSLNLHLANFHTLAFSAQLFRIAVIYSI